MSRCRTVIIADDLTGALDAAAPFAARGADTRVVISPERLAACLATWGDDLPEVLAVNVESRHLTAQAAAGRVVAAVGQLAPLAPRVWFKKLDSTLRGQVVAECLALREATGYPLLVAPAVPAQGRVVREAEVWVEGVPLAESAYARDGRSAALAGPLDRAFAAQGVTPGRYRPADDRLRAGDWVADAESDQDLARLYDAVLRSHERFALAGAAGLASAIAQRCFGRLAASPSALQRVPRRLYAIGSRSERAAEQCRHLCAAEPGMPRLRALEDAAADAASPVQLLVPGDEGSSLEPAAVAQAMGRRVAQVVGGWAPDESGLVFATGGDIARAALEALGVGAIRVDAEWMPGVALGRMDGDPNRLVMTKAGGFGPPDLLLRLHRTLR